MSLGFLRRDAARYGKFGKGKGKKAKWRSPKGRDNKMREKRKGYPKTVSIGYGTTLEKEIIYVSNLKELEKVNPKTQNIILRRVGEKKKEEIAKKAKEMKIEIKNFNAEKYLTKKKKVEEKKSEENKK